MDLGLMIFPTDQTIDPVELGREADERGFESLWFPEHSHIPVARTTPWGGRDGAPPLPDHYWRSYDQFVALAAVAATTTNLKVATGITLVAQRDPLWLAKEVASLDRLSNGRFMLGIGYGWNKEELAHHGVAYTDRRARLRESVLAMKELWTNDEAAFHGDHISFDASWAWPKPVQTPHPPVILGGSAGPKTAAHIAEFCDGWMPIGGRYDLSSGIDAVRAACEDIGRDPASVSLGVFGAKPDAESLEKLAAQGITRAVLGLSQGPRDEVLADLDRFTPLIDAARDL
ncbi:MAG: TIGR03619 family F420-dependent LLM class oxidoreductase [Acidimicrobiales bacterium]